MTQDDEKILKVAKEILVKFIEMGRVSTGNFDEHFRSVYWTIKNTVVSSRLDDMESPDEGKER
ncbi:MAG: conjugal transfer protein TraB [Desulfobacteraceae bacterium]|nr:conjugal transfer protein TraB [Desulfobacteraceae bacterium]